MNSKEKRIINRRKRHQEHQKLHKEYEKIITGEKIDVISVKKNIYRNIDYENDKI